jgi:hypothetical protein
MSESFSTQPLQEIIPSYLYQQYADDQNVQSFVNAWNSIAQSYLTWFNQTPLGVYTSPSISGALLDWIGQGIYGIERPVLSTLSTSFMAGVNAFALNVPALNEGEKSSSGTAMIASDDIYKRVLTWWLYRGDGKTFSVRWLKNRVNRFLNGPNGLDYAVLNSPPSIVPNNGNFTITVPHTTSGQFFSQCVSNNVLCLPFQYTYTVDIS